MPKEQIVNCLRKRLQSTCSFFINPIKCEYIETIGRFLWKY